MPIQPNYDDDEDDDGEYELEPPDPEVIAAEKASAAKAVDEARHRVRLQELSQEPEQKNPVDYLPDITELRLRFTIKQIMIVTTIVAIVLSFALWKGGFVTLLIGTFIVLASAYGYITWQENKRRQEWYREREAFLERNKPEAKR